MKILMMTNTYPPHVGGVARSVERYAWSCREAGHEVLVVAPTFAGTPEHEDDVVRIPALQKFNGSDFSVRLPIPATLFPKLDAFQPDIVHSHHPFLLGDTALRIAARQEAPVIFTHHTLYEHYTQYVPGGSRALRQFVINLATEYANLCHHVIAPSESIAQIIRSRGVDTPIAVIPTGLDVARFAQGDRAGFRRQYGLSDSHLVIGHVGRLAFEKNLVFLADAVAAYLADQPNARFLVVGKGAAEAEMRRVLFNRGIEDRLIMTGELTGQELIDAYHAMDLFVFTSLTETQGMVLAEAMAARLPVVAVDASGVREIVRDGYNGFLLSRPRKCQFTTLIQRFFALTEAERATLRDNAYETAKDYDQQRCASELLELYRRCAAAHHPPVVVKDSAWERTLRQVETEWSLIKNKVRAAGLSRLLSRHPPLVRLEQCRRFLRRLVSRARWSVRLLNLPRSQAEPTSAGLVLLQIDGLSRPQFERALQDGRLPFIRRLLRRESYDLHTLYSGVPSTTPAVQGELFYGSKAAVPAFAFVHPEQGTVGMLQPDAVRAVEKELEKHGPGLLSGGSCYSDIYHGGANEPHFGPAAVGWQRFLSLAHPIRVGVALLLHGFVVVRTLILLIVELLLAISDGISGILKGENLLQEIKFIPARVGICIFLRELICAGAMLDIDRGVPIVHANFIGYDEQAHRRGPDSYFAHWTLKGIDRAVAMIWRAAERATGRRYQVWIYSDHGQERTLSYRQDHGQSVQAAVADLFNEPHAYTRQSAAYHNTTELHRAGLLGGKYLQRLLKKPVRTWVTDGEQIVRVTAKGPLGHVYVSRPLDLEEKCRYAVRMVQEAHIPLVLIPTEPGQALAFTQEGQHALPREAACLYNEQPLYYPELVDDLIALCHHRYAGDFIISGWRKSGPPLSFPVENGAHGGPGIRETHGIAILPRVYRSMISDKSYLRAGDLRRLALCFRKRTEETLARPSGPVGHATDEPCLRVMTYNVHGCRGMDDRILPERTAEVIACCEPDVVCLQELDAGRARSHGENQAEKIARLLAMKYHFHPSVQIGSEQYGNAILTRHSCRMAKSGPLPGIPGRPDLEPRGALWIAVEKDGLEWQVVTTHLGLLERERSIQTNALLSKEWLGDAICWQRVVFCGDLNIKPGSFNYQRLCRHLADSQESHDGDATRYTWSSRLPCRTLDYIFVSNDLKVRRCEVLRTHLAKTASDHLPVVADICTSRPLKKGQIRDSIRRHT